MILANPRNCLLLAWLTLTSVAHGQRFHFGAKGGVPITNPSPLARDESRRYLTGATAELRLFGGFAAGVDFLYRRNGFTQQFPLFIYDPQTSNLVQLLSDRTRLHVFEVPVFGKYYFRREEKVQPFLLTGYSLRKARSASESAVYAQSPERSETIRSRGERWTALEVGASVGAGVRWRLERFSLVPEFRYTYWGPRPDRGLSRRQLDFLLGITF